MKFSNWKIFTGGIIAIFLFFLIPLVTHATTYYVSTSGSDSNTAVQAQSTTTPWKHHPWDSNATDTAHSTTLVTGDIVVMKKRLKLNILN